MPRRCPRPSAVDVLINDDVFRIVFDYARLCERSLVAFLLVNKAWSHNTRRELSRCVAGVRSLARITRINEPPYKLVCTLAQFRELSLEDRGIDDADCSAHAADLAAALPRLEVRSRPAPGSAQEPSIDGWIDG